MAKYKSGEDVQHKIVESAFYLFATQGYEKTTVNQIMERVNKTKGTFYAHYGSKEDVFIQIMNERMKFHKETAEKAFIEYSGNDAIPYIEESVTRIVKQAQSDKWIPMFFEFLAHTERNEKVREHINNMIEDWKKFLVSIFVQFQEQGKLNKSIDVELMASTLLALFHGFCIQAHVNPNVDPLKQVQLISKLFS